MKRSTATPPSVNRRLEKIVLTIGALCVTGALALIGWQLWQNQHHQKPLLRTEVPPASELLLQTGVMHDAERLRLQSALQTLGVGIQQAPLLPKWLQDPRPQQWLVHAVKEHYWLERRDAQGRIALQSLNGEGAQIPRLAKAESMPADRLAQGRLPRRWWKTLLPSLTAASCSLWAQWMQELPEQATVDISNQDSPQICLHWDYQGKPPSVFLPPLQAHAGDNLLLAMLPSEQPGCPASTSLLRVWQEKQNGLQLALTGSLPQAANPWPEKLTLTPVNGLKNAWASSKIAANWLRQTQAAAAGKDILYSYFAAAPATPSASDDTTPAHNGNSAGGTEVRVALQQNVLSLCLRSVNFAMPATTKTKDAR